MNPNQQEQQLKAHTHNGVDSLQITGASIAGCPMSALTAQSGSLTTGGAAVLSTSDADTLINTINRVNEIESRLRSIGIIL
jgi:hypothetical protein